MSTRKHTHLQTHNLTDKNELRNVRKHKNKEGQLVIE